MKEEGKEKEKLTPKTKQWMEDYAMAVGLSVSEMPDPLSWYVERYGAARTEGEGKQEETEEDGFYF